MPYPALRPMAVLSHPPIRPPIHDPSNPGPKQGAYGRSSPDGLVGRRHPVPLPLRLPPSHQAPSISGTTLHSSTYLPTAVLQPPPGPPFVGPDPRQSGKQ